MKCLAQVQGLLHGGDDPASGEPAGVSDAGTGRRISEGLQHDVELVHARRDPLGLGFAEVGNDAGTVETDKTGTGNDGRTSETRNKEG